MHSDQGADRCFYITQSDQVSASRTGGRIKWHNKNTEAIDCSSDEVNMKPTWEFKCELKECVEAAALQSMFSWYGVLASSGMTVGAHAAQTAWLWAWCGFLRWVWQTRQTGLTAVHSAHYALSITPTGGLSILRQLKLETSLDVQSLLLHGVT